MTKKTPGERGCTVGYGRPPKDTQFKKGKRGNPKGKPKGARSIAVCLDDALSSKVTHTENGKSRKVPRLQAIMHRLSSDALRGEKAAIKLVVALAEKYGDAPESKINLSEFLSEDAAILAQLRRDGLLTDVKAEETPEPEDDEDGGDEEEGGDGGRV